LHAVAIAVLTSISCLGAVTFLLLMIQAAPSSALFPYTTLFRSDGGKKIHAWLQKGRYLPRRTTRFANAGKKSLPRIGWRTVRQRSEEHTSELQSRENLVCRLLLEKKKIGTNQLFARRTRSRSDR